MVRGEKMGRTGVRDTSLCRKRAGAKETGFRLQTTEPSGIPPLRCDGSTCRFSLTTGSTGQTRLHGTVITACRMCSAEHFKVVSATGYEMCTISRVFVRWNTCWWIEVYTAILTLIKHVDGCKNGRFFALNAFVPAGAMHKVGREET